MSTRPNHVCTAKPASTWVDGFYKLLTKLLTSDCNFCYDTIFSECDPSSKGRVVAISGVVDKCSISTGDRWIWVGRNRFRLRSVTRSRIFANLQELGCVKVA
jgi:hypothetical protein